MSDAMVEPVTLEKELEWAARDMASGTVKIVTEGRDWRESELIGMGIDRLSAILPILQAAVDAERERCAKVAEGYRGASYGAIDAIAAAIRALGGGDE